MTNSRIKFYSEYDLSAGWYLQKIENFLNGWKNHKEDLNINDILELYNIKRYFDTNLLLKSWDANTADNYKCIVKTFPSIIGGFCSKLSNENFIRTYKELDREYMDDFWQMIADFKIFNQISPECIDKLLEEKEFAIWNILYQKLISEHFGAILAKHLVNNKKSAERLISHYLEKERNLTNTIYFPKEFSQKLRTQVIVNYIEQEQPNINYLHLLVNAQSTQEFPIDDRLKLKARKKCEIIQNKLFSEQSGISYGIEVSFKSIPNYTIEESSTGYFGRYSYSREWIEENNDYPTLLNNFIHLFGYVDYEGRCSFSSLIYEMGVLENIIETHGKKDYIHGISFNIKDMLSTIQMVAYQDELHKYEICVEDLVKWFFEIYLTEEFDAKGFSFSPPSKGTTYAEKCKLIAISIDGILKQFRLYCEDGFVDRELLEISSGHIVFSNLNSLLQNKYAYIKSEDFSKEAFLFYSDQATMAYPKKGTAKYSTLSQLLSNEQLTIDDFHEFQQDNIRWLIERGIILVKEKGFLNIEKDRALFLCDLYKNEVLCPHCYDTKLRKKIDELVLNGDLKYENTLFSKPEQDYLDYMLNRSKFSNGLDLRNKYSHDTCSLDERIQIQDYFKLLKILILIVLKINEEFCNRFPEK